MKEHTEVRRQEHKTENSRIIRMSTTKKVVPLSEKGHQEAFL
jgi:hypothetical protein